MALAVAQVGGNVTTSSGAISFTFGSSTTTGSLIAVVGHTYNTSGSAAGTDTTDNKSNTYSLAGAILGGASTPGVEVCYNNAGTRGASHQCTYDAPGASESNNVGGIEITGQDGSAPFDATTLGTASDSSSPLVVTAGGAIVGNQIAIGGVTIDTGVNQSITDPAGYTPIIRQEDGSAFLVSSCGYKINETGTPSIQWVTGGITAAREIFVTFKESTGAAPAASPIGALFGPNARGPFAWFWSQSRGVDPTVVVTAAQPWAQIIATPDTMPPLLSAAVYPGLYPGLVETVPQAFFLQAGAIGQSPPVAFIALGLQAGTPPVTSFFVPVIQSAAALQPLQVLAVIPGWDPSRVETVPVPRLIQASAIPGPAPSSALALGWFPGLAETIPVPRLIQAAAIPGPPATSQLARGLDPSSVETVPLALLIQSTAQGIIPLAVQVALGLTPGTPPPTSWFVPFLQAANIVPVRQQVAVQLGLTPGTPPVTLYFVPTIQGVANLTVPLQSTLLARGVNPQILRTVPIPLFVQSAASAVPLQPANIASVLNPQLVRTVPVAFFLRSAAPGQPLQPTSIRVGLVVAAAPASPTLTPPFTTLAVIDGRITTTPVADGTLITVETADGRIISSAVVDGAYVTTTTNDGRRGTT